MVFSRVENLRLREEQEQVFFELNEFVKRERARRGTICLSGPHQSGKTTVLLYFLWKNNYPLNLYINANLFVINNLNKRKELEEFSKLEHATKKIIENLLRELLNNHFLDHDIMILDSIELLNAYNIDIVNLAWNCATDGKICIISTPLPRSALNSNLCKIIELG
ncbi:MAG: ATP-binding protein, partial [Candidatus Heimdallarchaeota archaeon]